MDKISIFVTEASVIKTGLTPTIIIYNLSDGTTSSGSMSEVGGGVYEYDFDDFDSAKSYTYVVDTTLSGVDRYKYGGNTIGDGLINEMIQNGQFTSEALANAPKGGGGSGKTINREMTEEQRNKIEKAIIKELKTNGIKEIIKELSKRNLEFDIDTSKLEKVAKKLEENAKKSPDKDKWLDNALESILTAVMNSKSEMLGKDDIKACFLSEIKKLPKQEIKIVEKQVGYEIPVPVEVEKQVVVETLDKTTLAKLEDFMGKLGITVTDFMDKSKEPTIAEKRQALEAGGVNTNRLTDYQVNRMSR